MKIAAQVAACAAAFLILAPGLRADVVGQSNLPPGQAFVSACAGSQAFSTLPDPGSSFANYLNNNPAYSPYTSCNTGAGAVAGANSGLFVGSGFNNQAFGSATTGDIKLFATNTGSTSVTFPGAVVNGGWNDMITITGGSGAGIWQLPILVHGTMDAVGDGAAGVFEVAAYSNHNVLQPYGNAANQAAYNDFRAQNNGHFNLPSFGGINLSSWDYQMAAFFVEDYGPTDSYTFQHFDVNQVVTFDIPFTYGVAFELGIFADLSAGERAAGGPGAPQNTTTLDFSHTLTWNGPGKVVGSDGSSNPTTDFVITGQSGFDYESAVVPEPASFVLIGGALTLLALVRVRPSGSRR